MRVDVLDALYYAKKPKRCGADVSPQAKGVVDGSQAASGAATRHITRASGEAPPTEAATCAASAEATTAITTAPSCKSGPPNRRATAVKAVNEARAARTTTHACRCG